MRISDALLYIIYKNGKLTSYDLLNYIKRLQQYDVLEVNEDGISFSLTDKGIDRLVEINLVKVSEP